MPPDERDAGYIWDILLAARSAVRFVTGTTLEGFARDPLLRSAVERQLTIVGEAARRVSEAFKGTHPELPWREMIAQRNVLVYDYGEIVPDFVWLVVTDDLPALILLLEPLARPPDQKL